MVVAPPPPPGLIVYDQVSLDGQRTFVFRERADGSSHVLILRDGYDPVWSPDGRYVAAFQRRGIAIVTRGGRVVRRIRSIGSTAYLTWSPDGRWLGYIAQHCDSEHQDPACGTLWVVRVDGTGQRRASPEGGVWIVNSFEKPYTWSPDGRRLAYAGVHGLVISEVLTGRRHLLGPSARIKANPDWSPDGRRLLYAYGSELVTSAPDGGDRRLVRGAHDTLLAAWSPDGSRIAYIQGTKVFVSRPDGSGRRRVRRDAGDRPFLWSSDGRYVLFGVAGGDAFEIVSVSDGRQRVIRGGEDGDWR